MQICNFTRDTERNREHRISGNVAATEIIGNQAITLQNLVTKIVNSLKTGAEPVARLSQKQNKIHWTRVKELDSNTESPEKDNCGAQRLTKTNTAKLQHVQQ